MYVTKSEIEQYMGLSINEALTAFINTLIQFATDYIENTTGREFEAEEDDQTKYYDGNGATRLEIDDLRELTSLTVDGEALTENEDFYLYPLNATGEDEDPYLWIELLQPETRLNTNSRVISSSPYVFERAQRNVVVVGTFGYSETPPAAVKVAALKLISGIIKENIGDADLKEVTSETLGEYSVTYAKVKDIAHSLGVDTLLEPYKRSVMPKRKAGVMQAS